MSHWFGASSIYPRCAALRFCAKIFRSHLYLPMSASTFSFGSANEGQDEEVRTSSDGEDEDETEGSHDSALADSSSALESSESSESSIEQDSESTDSERSVDSGSIAAHSELDSAAKQSLVRTNEHDRTATHSDDSGPSYSTDDSAADEDYVPQKKRIVKRRRNPHRAARDPAVVVNIVDAPPVEEPAPASNPPPTEREARLRAQRELERTKRLQAEAEVERLTSLYETTRDELDTANVELAKALSAHESALDTAAGESPAAVRPRGGLADMQRVLNKPATYEGSNEACHIVDWLVAMLHYLMTLRVPSIMFVTTASTYLRGEALRFWSNRQQTLTSSEASDWDMFREAMLERFDSENTAVTARIKLDSIKQGDMSMAKFVQKFDFITSYISDMADADLIHRFLMAVRPECKPALQNDPSTGVRWTEYVKLRKYALNMYPYASMPQGGRDPKLNQRTHPAAAAAAVADGAADLRSLIKTLKRKRGAVPGPEGGNRDKAGPSRQPPLQGGGKVYENSLGKKVSRTPAQVKGIFTHQVCAFCYGKGHRATECTAAHPTKGFPNA